MIKIELDESEARELLDAARDMCQLWFDKYKTAIFHASKLADIGAKIEDSLNKE